MTSGTSQQNQTPANAQPVNAYLRTQVLTATPEKLRLMLLDGTLRFLRSGRDGLVRKDFQASFEGFSQARDILVELMTSMKSDVAPELCARVRGLYTFIYQTVVEASLEKDVAKADKAIELMEFERETWAMAIEKLAQEKALNAPAPTASLADAASTSPRLALSVQG